jgi:NADPH:quinone reductase-like Zn-dependent oxidoreductase
MKTCRLSRFSAALDGLVLEDSPRPALAHGQVRVRVRAVSLNYRDLLVARGVYTRNPRVGLVPCSDGAGEVVEVGDGVTQVRVGTRVAGTFFQGWQDGAPTRTHMRSDLGGGLDGMLAEEVVLDERGVIEVPAYLTWAEAATLPCAAVTAWHALVSAGRLRAGDTVLVLGTGGVSLFALQFARLHGARVIATSGSDAKLERARALGADGTVNYRTMPAWDDAVLALTGGEGVDHVVEVGGAGTLPRSLRAARLGGRVSLIGVLTGGEIDPRPVLGRSLTLQGIYVGSRAMFADMNRAISGHGLKPVIDRIFPFAEAAAAYRHLEGAGHFGKVVIAVE